MNLVVTRREADPEAPAEVAAVQALEKSVRQAELEHVGRPSVQPIAREVEISSHTCGSLGERFR